VFSKGGQRALSTRDVGDRQSRDSEARGRGVDARDRDLVVYGVVGTHLERDGGSRAVEHLRAVELGHVGHARDLGHQALELRVQRGALTRAQRTVGRLDGELAHPDQVAARLVESTFGDLQERDAVERVSLCLLEAADLGAEPLRDRQAGGVVGCASNAQARRQAAQRALQLLRRVGEVSLSSQRSRVGVDP
jgi:hypothetical protein